MLVPELRKEPLGHGTVNLTLKNWGRSAATNVQIEVVNPRPPARIDDLPNDNMLKWIYPAYRTPIILWPPSWEMTYGP